jgi:hypothetical protein
VLKAPLTNVLTDVQLNVVEGTFELIIIGAVKVLVQIACVSGTNEITGLGLMAILKVCATPVQPAAEGVTVINKVSLMLELFVIVWAGIMPVLPPFKKPLRLVLPAAVQTKLEF